MDRRSPRPVPLAALLAACLALVALPAALLAAPSPAATPAQAASATPATAAGTARADTAPAPRVPDERPEIVFIHTVGSSAAVWSKVLPYFQGSWHAWTYELPGHGRTPPIPGLTITRAAQDLGEYLQREGVRYPVLVGHGMGGLIAMRYTFDHPADVRRLIVIDAAPRQQATEQAKEMTAKGLAGDYDRWVASRFIGLSADSLVSRQIMDQALRTEPVSLINLIMSSFDFDLTEELPRQSVPILVIGSEGFFPDASRARQRLDELGYAKARTISFKRIAHAGHFVMLEQPVMLSSVIMAFGMVHQTER